ncbi:DUF3237 family protein [Paenibacillus sp. DXFW5]|uniref:DUF3237 family protein n=1 Tax=Paenibacillus rhizolycopersici TaxID=2780073 RepID=A0ABS2H9P8_9BACL|nr:MULTISPECIES: DUF3237 family protein [Paenibacillus]MBM6996546.1 DUF3237 family protein [Paenibacillus rhizolycopersici]GIP47898.1 hypothetical protein J53TS2_14890 [Paenibacillus sp. J53TS2]
MEFEEIFTVHVQIESSIHLNHRDGDSVTMISFKGRVTGKYFEGEILAGGVDTQIIGKLDHPHTLSARYMLEGKDHTGERCKVYIENNGNMNHKLKNVLFRSYPKVITDSKALAFLNDDILVAEGSSTESGLDIKIYRAL